MLLLAAPLTLVLTTIAVTQEPLSRTAAQWLAFTYLSFLAWYRGLAVGPMTTVNQVQPVLSTTWATLPLGEHLSWTTAVGGLVAILCARTAVRTRLNNRSS